MDVYLLCTSTILQEDALQDLHTVRECKRYSLLQSVAVLTHAERTHLVLCISSSHKSAVFGCGLQELYCAVVE